MNNLRISSAYTQLFAEWKKGEDEDRMDMIVMMIIIILSREFLHSILFFSSRIVERDLFLISNHFHTSTHS